MPQVQETDPAVKAAKLLKRSKGARIDELTKTLNLSEPQARKLIERLRRNGANIVRTEPRTFKTDTGKWHPGDRPGPRAGQDIGLQAKGRRH